MNWLRDPGIRPPLPSTLPHGKPWPLISIVTPSYGQGEFIEETILSVLNQGYPNVEHIVIDGGSKDGTAAILEQYRDRLTYAVSEPDRGQSHAINKGMARANGEIVTWLNSDDRLAPGALAGMAMAFQTTGADMVAGICELWRDGHMVDRHLTSCEDGLLPLDDLLDLDRCWNVGQFFFQPEVFFTKDLWNRAGGRVDEESFYSMDYELWLRFAEAKARIAVIGRPIVQFRLHAAQKTNDHRLFQAELPKVRQRFLDTRGLQPAARVIAPAPKRPTRVVFFNDIRFKYGAGIAHGRLAAAMEMAGHEVTVVAARDEPGATGLPTREQDQLLQAIAAGTPDIVIVGNLHGAGVTPAFLARIAARWPTAFVVHDLWIATGRCAYTQGCDKLVSGCDASCPTPTEYPALSPSLIAPAWAAKRQLLSAPHAPLLLANSEWTKAQLQRALDGTPTAKAPVEAITLGVPHEFAPTEKAASRRLLGLPEGAFLIMLSATSLSDPRKGRAQLVDALARLTFPDIELLMVGFGEDVAAPGFTVHRFPYIDDPKTLSMIYSAADVFVGPSLEECLGQVFLEAAACGVPSVGFALGGVPEAIDDGATGLLAHEPTAVALADAILRIHDDAALRRDLSVWARIAFENTRTIERSYHRLHVVLRRALPSGDAVFGRKVSLRPPAVVATGDRGTEIWDVLTGFSPWEGPYPEWNLPRCRWQIKVRATFHLIVSRSGPHTLLLRFRNTMVDQHVRISCADTKVFDGSVDVTRPQEETLLRLDVHLDAPRTLITCEASTASTEPDGRMLVLLWFGVEVVPKFSPPPPADPSKPAGLRTILRSLLRRAREWLARIWMTD